MADVLKKYAAAIANLLLVLGIFLICIFIAPKIILLFMPFIFGWSLALLANPPVRFLEKKLKLKRKVASALVIVFVVVCFGFGIYIAGEKIVEQAVKLGNELPQIWYLVELEVGDMKEQWTKVVDKFPKEVVLRLEEVAETMGQEIQTMVTKLSIPTADGVGTMAQNIPGILMSVIMCLLSAYFFVAEKDFGAKLIKKYFSAEWVEKFALLKKTTVDVLMGYIKAQFKIEIWIYLITAVGLMLLRVQYGYLVAVFIAVLDILPVFGTGTILLPWAIFKVLNGRYMFATGLLIIWGVGQLARQIIQPKVIGDSMGIAPIPTLILLYVGYKLAGLAGMIASIPFGILVRAMNEIGFFETGKTSIRVLWHGFQTFRQFGKEDVIGSEMTESIVSWKKEKNDME